jgi:hypothetical protein
MNRMSGWAGVERWRGKRSGVRMADGRKAELPAVGHKGLDLCDVAGLRALWTVNDLELHRLTLFE